MTAMLPLLTRITDSISRERMIGIVFMMPCSSRAGLGSVAWPMMRDRLGRRLSSTVSFSETCGVTFMTKPTGTECTVVVKVVRV